MTEQLDFGTLEAWVRTQQKMPAACARPLAALIAHYGLRLNETEADRKLRKSTIRFLDKAVPKRDPEDFDPVVDEAELRLDDLQRKRGGIWPIEAAIEGEDSPDRPSGREFTTLTVERGLGKQVDRGITDANLLLLLAVLCPYSSGHPPLLWAHRHGLRGLRNIFGGGPAKTIRRW